jgi:N-sulfoglucosamine sulfohydrolase
MAANRARFGRRQFLAGSAALAASAPFIAGAAGRSPNVIVITADDLGWQELGVMGNPDVKTPNLDRLAGEGALFTHNFVCAASCSPSRASIMTGQAPHSVGVLGLTHQHPQYQMSARVPTLARSLLHAGYATAIFNKWHVAPYKPVQPFGYQAWIDQVGIKGPEHVNNFIRLHRRRPFFLELNFTQPHRISDGSFHQHPDFPVDPESIHVPEYWRLPDWPEIREDVAGYYSQIASMDHIIGRIVERLDAEGLSENTLIAFISDNGAPYPGCKTTCYDPGIGSPLILRWPGGISAGRRIDDLTSAIDLMPTCLDAAGVSVPETVQGVSLLGLARGESGPVHEEVFSEITYHVIYTPMRSIRTRRHKYIENLSADPTMLDQNKRFDWAQRVARLPGQTCCVPRPPEELFDLDADPREEKNLAADPTAAELMAGLRDRLHRWRQETRDPFPDLSGKTRF